MTYLVLALLFFLLFIYPFAIYPRLLALLPQRALSTPRAGSRPSFTLVFCAYNEEAALPEKLANLRRLKARHPELEILAYSDMSTDRTLELLQAEPDLLTAVPASERLGKAWGMRQLVARARSDVIIFTDANVTLQEDAIDRLAVHFSDPEIGTVAGQLRYVNEGDSATAEVGHRYWSLEERIKALESRTGSTMGADGAIFARRRDGYPDVPPALLDDLTASIFPLFSGLRVISAADVIAYERLTTQSRDEFRRKRRIACRAFNTHRYLAPHLAGLSALDRFKYISHKLLRWMSPFSLALSACFAVLALLALIGPAGLLVALVPALGLAGLWQRRHPAVLKGAEILLALLATARGVLDSLAGRTYQTWTPAKSRNA